MYSLAELNTILYNLGVFSGNIPRATNVRGGKFGAIPCQTGFGLTQFINPNRFTVRKFLTSVGDGTEGFTPTYEYITLDDISDLDLVYVPKSLYNANTILASLLDNNPLPLNIPEQTLLGRITGGDIEALTIAQLLTLLSIITDHGDLAGLSNDDHTQYAPKASPTFTGVVETPATKITTGAGLAKVLTSDADGDATWQTPSANFADAALGLLDTNASHYLRLDAGSDLSADRILSFITGDSARSVTLNGNPTLNDWFDQAVKQASVPTFNFIHALGTTSAARSDFLNTTSGSATWLWIGQSYASGHAGSFGFIDNADGTSGCSFVSCYGDDAGVGTGLLVKKGGNVGIGLINPQYLLHVNTDSAGKPGAGGLWTVVSDRRLKDNIIDADLDRCYDIVKSVPLKNFTWKDEAYSNEQIGDRTNIGWIADDVQKVFPKSVNVKPFTKNAKVYVGEEEYEEQDFRIDTIEEKTITIVDGKPIQTIKTVERTTLLFDNIEVKDESGQVIIENEKPLLYSVPRMSKKTRAKYTQEVIEDCLDLNGGQMLMAMYGTIQKLMQEIEDLKVKIK